MINNNLKIITSLYVYNRSLFITNLDGSIDVFPLDNLNINFPKNMYLSRPYRLRIDTKNIPIKLQGYKHVLFISTPDYLYSIDLIEHENISSISERNQLFRKEIPSCTHLKIDYNNKKLIAVSQTRGLVILDISNPRNPRYITDLRPSKFKKIGKLLVTDLDVHKGKIFLALRNWGILRIDYTKEGLSEPQIFREIKKIKLADPQDVKFMAINNHLFIADYEEGLIQFNIENGAFFQKVLPQNDIPIRLLVYKNKVFIKGKRGFYLYDVTTNNILNLLPKKIGEFYQYGDYLFFTLDNSLNLLVLSKKDVGLENLNSPLFQKIYTIDNQLNELK